MSADHHGCRFRTIAWAAWAAIIIGAGTAPLHAQKQVQCFSIDFFYDSKVDDAAELRAALDEFAAGRKGLKLYFTDVHEDEDARKRVDKIAKYFELSELKLPAIYGLKNVLADLKTKKQLRKRLEQVLTLTAFVRNGCPHCRAAKAFLKKYGPRYPALKIVYREVTTDPNAQSDMHKLTSRYRRQAASLPVMHFCNGLSIGFDRDATTGRRILKTLDYWSQACAIKKKRNK